MANGEPVHRSVFNASTTTCNNERLSNIRDRQTMRRTIIKQGYLKKLPNAARLGASIKRVEKRWFVFGTIGSTDPYIEYYENEESIFAGRPLNILFLDTCRKITRNQKTSRHCNIFTLVLTDRLLSLVAPTRDAMFEWSRAIEQKLSSLAIIEESSRHGNNDYIRLPFSIRRPVQEDPDDTQNLTQDPGQDRVYLDVQASGGTFAMVRAAEQDRLLGEPLYENLPITPEYLGLLADTGFQGGPPSTADDGVYLTAAEVDEDDDEEEEEEDEEEEEEEGEERVCANSNFTRLQRREIEAGVFNRRSLTMTLSDVSESGEVRSEGNSDDTPSTVDSADSLAGHQQAFVASDRRPSAVSRRRSPPSPIAKPTETGDDEPTADDCVPSPYEEVHFQPGNFSRYCELGAKPPPVVLVVASSPKTLKITTTRQYFFFDDDDDDDNEISSDNTVGANNNNSGRFSSPPPSSSSSSSSSHPLPPPPKPRPRGADVPVQKQTPLQKLIREMKDPSGIVVVIPKTQCRNTIAFADCFNRTWIVGWNQRLCPTFQSLLHIGDQLISINDSVPTSRSSAMRLLKLCSSSSSSGRMDATLHIRRLPCGQVFGFNRGNGSTNPLGLTMVNRTAEIGLVDPTGLARENGLEERAPAMNGAGGGGDGSWWVTEVNNQPLNLFSKEDEAKQRLNAPGSYVSFVVQPTQLVVEIKKQLRNTKGFRDFLVH